MTFTAYIARAFCHNSAGGNPAGVVITDKTLSLTHTQMQSIATKLNLSETVFLSGSKDTYQAKYYTPTSSIEFCGHATLAAFGVLKKLSLLDGPVHTLKTPVGKCEITVHDRLIFLSQQLPLFGESIQISDLTPILGDEAQIVDPPPQIVSTGLRDIFVSVKDERSLRSITPNLKLLNELNKTTQSVGLHLFSLNPPESEIQAHCRNFAPLYGIDEESATGSSSGALGCHLFNTGILPQRPQHRLLFRQGEHLNSPSDIYVHLSTPRNKIEKVECGGEVVVDEIKELKIPEESPMSP